MFSKDKRVLYYMMLVYSKLYLKNNFLNMAGNKAGKHWSSPRRNETQELGLGWLRNRLYEHTMTVLS